MRLITWNVNRRVSLLAGQAAALASREPDVVALQEVTVRSWPLWRAALETIGLPHAANGWIKPDTLAALRAGLEAGSGPRVFCGDLNTPRRESPDGSVISFARETRGRPREERGTRWDDAELGIVPRLAEVGFADAFRTVHGYASKEPSWVWRHGGGWRLDHVS